MVHKADKFDRIDTNRAAIESLKLIIMSQMVLQELQINQARLEKVIEGLENEVNHDRGE